MIATIMKCSYIFLMNATTFFHQWLIKLTNRHKLIVIFHRNNEQWNVTIMKYRNFSTYVQRQINIIFRKYKHFAKTYVNDIVVFFNFLKKHFRHLNLIFVLFKKYNIVIKIFKIYLDYFSISLLKQRVDNFDFTTTKKKIETIRELKFFRTFKHLETYLNKIEYLRQYIVYYIQKIESLQQRKTQLFRDAFNKKRVKKQHVQQTLLNSFIIVEKNVVNQFQNFFDKSTFLIHYDRFRIFFIDVDVFKKRKFDIVIYHVKTNRINKLSNFVTSSQRNDIESIMFLSKILSSIEQKYWSTKFEMIVIVWIVRKLRIMIINSNYVTIFYINHVFNVAITTQIKFTSSFVNKLNLKLIRTSMYFFQFRLTIYHRSKKFNLVSNVFNRFFNTIDKNNVVNNLNIKSFHFKIQDFENENFHVFNYTFIAMNVNFNHKLKIEYQKNKHWVKIYAMLFDFQQRVELKKSKFVKNKSVDTKNVSTIIMKKSFDNVTKNVSNINVILRKFVTSTSSKNVIVDMSFSLNDVVAETTTISTIASIETIVILRKFATSIS